MDNMDKMDKMDNSNSAPDTVEQQLRIAAKVFKYSLEGIFVTDLKGRIQLVNQSFEKITGYQADEVIGGNPNILKSGKHAEDYYKAIWETLAKDGQWQGEFINKRKNGELYNQRTTIATIKDEEGKAISYCTIFSDVTQLREAEQKLDSDIKLARQLQKSVLSRPIKNEKIHIDGLYLPSTELAGDMYAWYRIDEHKYGVILFDIMGHGVASSLVSMSIRSLLRGIITISERPKNVLTDLNVHMRYLFRQNDMHLSYFFTAVYLLIDLKNGLIEYASAGHPPGFLVDENKNVKLLDVGCPPVGLLPDLSIETEVLPIRGPVQLFLYTDGLSDSFGINTYENIEKLKQVVVGLPNLDSKQLLENVLTNVASKKKSFDDDVTMVAITIC